MRILIKNGTVINVFTQEKELKNVLIEDGKIIGVGAYGDSEADVIEDVTGKYICPGFIDGHMHIESTMLSPAELAKVSLRHGTTAVVADPHEIANVCGKEGIEYMLEASRGLPMQVYIMLPSCVPATAFDESGAVLQAADLEEYYSDKRVLGLAEVMNYPGVIGRDEVVMDKINSALSKGKNIDGHAPLLSGKELDKYIAAGIQTDHECSSYDEAKERIAKGQWVMIRQGTAAKNLEALIDLFDEPLCHRCLLVTDDRHPADLIRDGHIDSIIRKAVSMGKSPVTGITMATIRAAECFGLKHTGAIAPGYKADIVILNNLETVDVCDVYCNGIKYVDNKRITDIKAVTVEKSLKDKVMNSFHLSGLSPSDFFIEEKSSRCRVIKTIRSQLLTKEWITDIDWSKNNGVDTDRDIIKIAVIERHNHTNHIGLGFISGMGIKSGAVCSSVSHDSHNIVVIGTDGEDMAEAVNRVIDMNGGYAVALNGRILADIALPIAGLMAEKSAEEMADKNEKLIEAIDRIGTKDSMSALMTMAFLSLTVIPDIKMTTKGLVDVNRQQIVPLYV